ncbi:MAG: glycosyltransferase [Defluviitaleaceae bacterium]|nr:glycosyltransferase [Defluviitaleaceae bacterium]
MSSMVNQNIKVSVIIPCYNAASLLSKSLDSVLNQSLVEIEVICVDDGSTDQTLEILKRYADGDPRVRVLMQKNEYAGVARNNGMSVAHGKYLYFMDADDMLEPFALEKVYAQSERTNADICLFGAGTLDLKTEEVAYAYPIKESVPLEQPFSRKELAHRLIGIHHTAPWNRLYQKSFVEKSGLMFQPLVRSNDFFFCIATLVEADVITVVNECLYFRTTNSGTSLVETMDQNPYSFYDANKKLRAYLIEKGLFEAFKRSLILYHMVSARHVLSKLRSVSTVREVVLFLKHTYFEELEIWKYKDVLSNQKSHLRLLTYVMEADDEELATVVYDGTSKMIEQEVKISIVMPCYNAELFLRKSLDSILKQTLKAFEVICVDDGSTDGTVDILKTYSNRDSRVSFFTQKNQYAGVARNNGMEKARGKYVLFLDADDFFEPLMLEKMYRKAEDDMADICLTAGGKYDLRTTEVTYDYQMRYDMLPSKLPFSRLDTPETIFSVGYGAPWNKLFKRTFIKENNLKFQALRSSNDIFFVQSAMAIAQRITVADGWLFHYRVGSETSLVETLGQNPFCFYEAYKAVKQFLIEKGVYHEVRLGFKKAALGSGLYALRMMKTKASWLEMALFLKHTYLPELTLLEVQKHIPLSHREELAVLLDQNDDLLSTYRPTLRKNESLVPEQRKLKESFLNMPGVKVTIVVEPSFSGNLMRDCLVSIQNQTLTDIEILCISHETVEDHQKQLEVLASKDARITIIPNAGQTVTASANEAIRRAKGDYILFINGDDSLLQVALAHLYIKAQANALDDLLFEGVLVYDHVSLYRKYRNRQMYRYTGEYRRSVQTGESALGQITAEGELKLTHHMHLLKVDFLKNNLITFDETVSADYLFAIKSLTAAKRVMIHQEPLYVKNVVQASLTMRSELLEGINKVLADCEAAKIPQSLTNNLISRLLSAKKNMLSEMMESSSYMKIVKFEKNRSNVVRIGLELKVFKDVNIEFLNILLKLRSSKQVVERRLAIHQVNQLNEQLYAIEFDFDVKSMTYVPLYYDLYLAVSLDGNEFDVRIENPTYQVKKTIYLKIRQFEIYFKNGFKIYPYLLEGKYLSFTYRLPEPGETNFNRMKEQVAYFWYLLFQNHYDKKKIWLGFEKNAETASDNGFAFFKHCYEHKKYDNFYYVLKKNSNEMQKLAQMKDRLLIHMSFKYMVYLYASKLLIASESKQHVYNIRAQKGRIQNVLNKKHLVFLQHGVIAFKKVPFFKVSNHSARPKVFEVASNYEKEIVQKYLGYNEHELMVAGLCRWDNLMDRQHEEKKKKIFVMPTWRDWLDSALREDFIATNYYQTYKKLLDDPFLGQLLIEKGLELHFLLHPKFKMYSQEFRSTHANMYVHTFGEVDVASMLMACSILITDYSSIAWDMYYMGKPIIFYQFDLRDYEAYQGAYIDLERDVFGDTVKSHEGLIQELNDYIENNFSEKEQFKNDRYKYFDHVDHHNSERTFEFINARKEELYSSDKETLLQILKRNLKLK